MPFPEPLKREVRRRAAFRCCACDKRSMVLEIHHIRPEADGGEDHIDNAAPLCPTCHRLYGDNPRMRTRLREMRDCLYESVEQIAGVGLFERIQALESAVHDVSAMIEAQQLDRSLADVVEQRTRDFVAPQERAIADLGFCFQSSSQPGTPDMIVDLGGRRVAVEFKLTQQPPSRGVAGATGAVMSDFVSSSGSVAGIVVYPFGATPGFPPPPGVQYVDETEVGATLQEMADSFATTCRDCSYFYDDVLPSDDMDCDRHYYSCSHPTPHELDVEYWDDSCGERGPADFPPACENKMR